MATAPHLLHVSCFVRDEGGLWHLLRGLEAHGVHGVEVQPVAPDAEAALTGRAVTAQMLPTQEPPRALVAHDPPPARRKHRPTNGKRGGLRDELSRSMILAHLDHQEPRSPSDVALRVGMPVKTVNNRLWNMAREGIVSRPETGLYILLRRPAGARS